jgi:hypothetical protein
VPVSTAGRTALGATALILALAGCGGSEQKPSVATAGGTPSALATGDTVTAYVEDVRKYVACLRAEGVEVTDPDAKGKFEYSGDPKMFKSDPEFRAAQTKCTDLLPPMPEGLEEKPTLTAEEIAAKGRYAQCMRENGVADFPDPGPDGHWPESSDGKPTWDQGTSAAKRAEATCGSIVGAPASPGAGEG